VELQWAFAMLTWLDYYIEQTINHWKHLVGPEGPIREANGPEIAAEIEAFARMKKAGDYLDQLDIVRHLAYRLTIQSNDFSFRMQAAGLGSKGRFRNGERMWPWFMEVACFAELLPFLGRGAGAPGWPHEFAGRADINVETITAVQPDAALVQLLADARPPADPEGYLERALSAGGTWYIDLPHRSVLLGDGEVRAIFLMPGLQTGHRVTAVITPPGQDKVKGRVIWHLGAPEDCYGHLINGVDMKTIAGQVNDLVRLLILYRATAESAERSELKHMDARQLNQSPRRIPQNRKKTSLFRVERLAAPADRFGRQSPSNGPAGGWTLGWQSEVSGHFKLQPHGVGRSLRKLIWIDAYERGPKDAAHKVRLERLTKPA
jgi:hypothetical protein